MVTAMELDQISALLTTLTSEYSPANVDIGVDATISDVNGDKIGAVAYSADSGGYVLTFATQ